MFQSVMGFNEDIPLCYKFSIQFSSLPVTKLQ